MNFFISNSKSLNLLTEYISSFSQTLFWLPRKLPLKVHLIVSVNATDLNKVVELTEERGYSAIHMSPLKEPEREEVALVRQSRFCHFSAF